MQRRCFNTFTFVFVLLNILVFTVVCSGRSGADIDLSSASLVIQPASQSSELERTAAKIFVEEVSRRTGVTLSIANQIPSTSPSIILTQTGRSLAGVNPPEPNQKLTSEGFAIVSKIQPQKQTVIWLLGNDPRGCLYAVGKLLRMLRMSKGTVTLPDAVELFSSPTYKIRGHQLGYRATANSYDAWSPEQFDQYIRELAIFGCNSVEGIPFHDDKPTVSPYPREKMNVDISRICKKYGQDYWLWVPADFDLNNIAKRTAFLSQHESLFKQCPELTGVFVAGGDPGDNPAELVIPYLEDLSRVLIKSHPKAKIWLSMQGYRPLKQDIVYRWLEKGVPSWFGGIVAGPGSPSLPSIHDRIPKGLPIRDYPDITHSVRCQFPVPFWDPAFAFTLGRECYNPRPEFFARVIRDTAPYTSGFISYSDGVHDDVNKFLWSQLEWNPNESPNQILMEYSRFFFGDAVATSAAAGLSAFEKSWQGSAIENGSIDANFALWRQLDQKNPELKSNWRWQLAMLRANYDFYVRHRLIYESGLETQVNRLILAGSKSPANEIIKDCRSVLGQAEKSPVLPEIRSAIVVLCDELYKSIGLQTSVEKYHASGSERGAILDFVDYPLNNRLWLNSEFDKILAIPDETTRMNRLKEIARWENPGPGSYYDDIGHVGRSPHEVRNERVAGPLLDYDNLTMPGVMWWLGASPLANSRQSWFTDEAWPTALKYPPVDPNSDYEIRTTGFGDCLIRVNGFRIPATSDGRNIGDIKVFPIPRGLYKEGKITVTFDPTFEPHLNWRQQSRLTEIWLIKK